MTRSEDRLTVRVKPHSYQPSEAELQEPFVTHKLDESIPKSGELVRAALRPVNLVGGFGRLNKNGILI